MSSEEDTAETIELSGESNIDQSFEAPVEEPAAPPQTSPDSPSSSPPRKKFAFDFMAVTHILVDVDPDFVEATWRESGENIENFNEQIMHFFETKNYKKIEKEAPIPVVDLVTPLKKAFRREKTDEDITLTCQCCYEEAQYEDVVECSKELHTFCENCIKRLCEVSLGSGDGCLKCMAECDGTFSMVALEAALPEPLYKKIQQKQQIAEIKEAEIEGLESCPFCDFSYVPVPTSTVFECLNEECMKDSCRLCKKESHIPLKCHEVLKEKDIRQKIEEAMTDSLLRQCYKCGKKFVKSDGCNKIVCKCGAMMCYICRQPVKDYNHFNAQGGDETWKCALWTSNDVLHVQEVQNAGIRIRDEEMAQNPDVQLSYDPTVL